MEHSKAATPGLTRRDLLKAGGLTVASIPLLGAAACGGGGGDGKLRMSWYGSKQVHTAMNEALRLFKKKHGKIGVSTQYSQFDDFWTKLSTQVTGGNAPDLWRHSMTYLLDYVDRGVLLDLSEYVGKQIDVSKLNKDVVDTGRIDGKYYAIGNNNITQAVFYKPKVFADAGVETPDDSWTWDDLADVAGKLSKATPEGVYGVTDSSGSVVALEPFMAQKSNGFFTEKGELAFTEDHLTEWFTFWDDLRKSKAATPAEVTAAGETFETNPLVKGKSAISFGWDQQLLFLQALVEDKLDVVMAPKLTDIDKPAQAVRALDFWTVYTRSENPDQAAQVIDFLLNDDGAAKALGLNLGGPPGEEFAAAVRPTVDATGKRLLDYMDRIIPKATAKLQPWAKGYAELLDSGLVRIAEDIAFGKQTIAKGVARFFDDAERVLS